MNVFKRLLPKNISFEKSLGILRRKEKTKPLKKVDFTLPAPHAQNVFLLGDFNGWETRPHSLKKDEKGNWTISINLSPGSYEYLFLVDGEYQNDPNCTASVENPFGSENSLLTLEAD